MVKYKKSKEDTFTILLQQFSTFWYIALLLVHHSVVTGMYPKNLCLKSNVIWLVLYLQYWHKPAGSWWPVVYDILSPFVPVDLKFLASYWLMTGVCTWHTPRTRCIITRTRCIITFGRCVSVFNNFLKSSAMTGTRTHSAHPLQITRPVTIETFWGPLGQLGGG